MKETRSPGWNDDYSSENPDHAKGLALATGPATGQPDKHRWRPIESAPRDGTEFLAFKAGSVFTACAALYNNFVPAEGGGFALSGQREGWSRIETSAVLPTDPTHWQPLPAPPESEQ